MNPVQASAGRRLLMINGGTWALFVIFLGYGVLNAPPAPATHYSSPGLRELTNLGGGPAGVPVQRTPSSTGEPNAQPGTKLHGMVAVPLDSPRKTAPPATPKDLPGPTVPGKPNTGTGVDTPARVRVVG